MPSAAISAVVSARSEDLEGSPRPPGLFATILVLAACGSARTPEAAPPAPAPPVSTPTAATSPTPIIATADPDGATIATAPPATPLAAAYDTRSPPNLFDAREKLTARLIARDYRGEFGFTPDGATVVYLSRTEGLVAIRPDGKDKRRLSGGPPHLEIAREPIEAPGRARRDERHPDTPSFFRVSRDSKTVVYGTHEGHVHSVSITGGAATRLTARPQQIGNAEITPDGTWVAISSIGGPVTLVPIRGGAPRPFLDAHPLGMMFKLTGDGRVVYRGAQHVFLRNLLDGTPLDLTPGLPRTDLNDVIDGAAVVSDDRVTYLAPFDRRGLVRMHAPVSWPPHAVAGGRGFAYHDPSFNLLYVDAKLRQPRIANRPLVGAEQVSPFFASNRKSLIYNIIDGIADREGRRNELRAVALDGSFEHTLAVAPDSYTVVMKATPDDRRVVVHVQTDAGTMAVFSIALDTRQILRLTPMWPGWSSFEVAANHAIVGVGTDLFVVDLP